jgi:site-specific DNA-methyltransferase (adenine-specific)
VTARFIVADVFDGLATIEDGSVDLVVTSPPFLALRSYLSADHPDKSKEIGSEATPAEFIDVMLKVTAELRRVLAPHGSICVELGDTYSGASTSGGDDVTNDRYPAGRSGGTYGNGRTATKGAVEGWPLAKSKTLIPQLYEIALAYGFNPLTGVESPAGRWRVRNVVTWARPNPPVGALGDKWRPATSDVVVACVSGKRYWDDLATRKPIKDPERERYGYRRSESLVRNPSRGDFGDVAGEQMGGSNPSGAPLLDYWVIPPTGYQGSHYAVFPPELVVPLVKAMCPERVCVECGEPSRPLVERSRVGEADDRQRVKNANGERPHVGRMDRPPEIGWEMNRETAGFTDCGHDNWRPGLVLDPFAGSGTTLLVATGHGHDAIGIDLDARNAELALERVGPFLLEVGGTP